MKTTVFLMTAAFAIAVPAFADTPVAPPDSAPTSQADTAANDAYLDKVVCKNFPPVTGTRLGNRRVCRTERAWREITRGSRDDITKRQTFHISLPGE